MVFDDASQKSSIVAAGLYNPVILKRFTEVWKAKEQLDIALPVYKTLERDLNITIDNKLKLLRRFTSIEEQNLWFNACDKINLEPFLSTQILKNTNPFIDAQYGFGQVLQTGRLDTEVLIKAYKAFLTDKNWFFNTKFQYNKLQIATNKLNYEDIEAQYIVFSEGFGVKQNPFFKHLPLNGTKGEVLTIKAPDLKLDFGIKSSVFLVPIGNDKYYVGATYNWKDKTHLTTEEGKNELVAKLRTFMTCDFNIINQRAGIRPTVKDRRPLVGRHADYKNLYILNGLGTRGVMIAPYVADKLYKYIENKQPLDPEINSNRFQ